MTAYTPCMTPAWLEISSYRVNHTFAGVSILSVSLSIVRCSLTWQPLHRSSDLGISLQVLTFLSCLLNVSDSMGVIPPGRVIWL